MAIQGRDNYGLARFGEPGLFILLALSTGPKHGYAILLDVEKRTGIQLGPGTLYGALTKLVDRKLITPLASESRRRPYRLTNNGQEALVAQLKHWERIVQEGKMGLAWA
jgi:DNA-binding PadR family transcriptional regulator